MPVSQHEGQESGSHSVQEAGCLSWSLAYVGILKKILIPAKESQEQDMIAETVHGRCVWFSWSLGILN